MVALIKGFEEEYYEDSYWGPSHLFPALRRLSINDHNKIQFVKKGIAPIWVSKIGKVKDDERTLTEMLEMMLNLSFMEENRVSLIEAKVPETLKTLQELPQVKKLVDQILWKLNVLSPEPPTSTASPQNSAPGHTVMISYNWESQKVVVTIAEQLKKEGFKVWLDLDDMTGSTLESMANAVESSSIVLVCMSRKYKESANCRLEGEYAFRKRKIIIPLMMQSKWEPDGWLGAILGTKLYFRFTSPDQFQSSITGVLKELRRYSSLVGHTTKLQDSASKSTPATKLDAKSWNPTQVAEWMKQIGMEIHLVEKFQEQKINGKSLAGLIIALQKGFAWSIAAIQPGGSLGFINHGESLQFLFELYQVFPE